MAAKKLRMDAALTTVVVVPNRLTKYPINMERMNCARNTMLLTMPTSVPRPRSCVPRSASPFLATPNYNKIKRNFIVYNRASSMEVDYFYMYFSICNIYRPNNFIKGKILNVQ